MTQSDTDLDPRALREQFLDIRGTWSPAWQAVLDDDPEFFAGYLAFAGAPHRSGALEPKLRELISISVDAAATHLYVPGIREHIRRALDLGATRGEIMEVLELTATLGIHACNIGVPILLEECGESQEALATASLTERQQEIKDDFIANRGYWNAFWDGMLHLDAEFFAGYTAFSSAPWKTGTLTPKVRELIYTAFDCAATHLYALGLRQHIRNALDLGATREEIMETFELASELGCHTIELSVPILAEEAARG